MDRVSYKRGEEEKVRAKGKVAPPKGRKRRQRRKERKRREERKERKTKRRKERKERKRRSRRKKMRRKKGEELEEITWKYEIFAKNAVGKYISPQIRLISSGSGRCTEASSAPSTTRARKNVVAQPQS